MTARATTFSPKSFRPRLAESMSQCAEEVPNLRFAAQERPLAIVTFSTQERAEQYLAKQEMSDTHAMCAWPSSAVIACSLDRGINWVLRDGQLIRLMRSQSDNNNSDKARTTLTRNNTSIIDLSPEAMRDEVWGGA